jgi:ubiquinone/menaquinone biosynthesis C-methylase UbiE
VDRPGPDRRFFDIWSRFYDLELVQRLTYRPVHDAVLRALVDTPVRRLLDLGCGTGLLTARIRAAHPAAYVVGCDFSAGMLRQAAAHPPAACWAQGDALRLPFRAATFDAVVSTEAFHWFPDQAAALREMFRVLVPGGRVLIALVNPAHAALGRAARLASRLAGEPLRWPTRERMAAELTAAGFRVTSQRRLFRLIAGILFPPVLTVALRPGT